MWKDMRRRLRHIIEKFNLSPIKQRVQNELNWDETCAEAALVEYRKFLLLAFLSTQVAPCSDVDQIWHAHILHTVQYHADTMELFGKYLHHFPKLSIATSEETKRQFDNYQRTLTLYTSLVHEIHRQDIWGCKESDCETTACFSGCNSD
jgi:hypothetical protein